MKRTSCRDGESPKKKITPTGGELGSAGTLTACGGRYQTEGQNTTFQSFNNAGAGGATFKTDVFKTLKSVVDDNLGMDEKPDFFSTRATVTYVKGDNLSYPACPTERCNKKMNQEGENQWRCEKCTMTYDAPQYRSVLPLSLL